MKKKDEEVFVKVTKEQWAALCFFASQAITGADLMRRDKAKGQWSPLAQTAMRAVAKGAQ